MEQSLILCELSYLCGGTVHHEPQDIISGVITFGRTTMNILRDIACYYLKPVPPGSLGK